ncbi:ferredoxin [Spongisporangium articulatum]|uniref:Ferredoxin n=1 Tax=Spongisporangium articulatum TaxID=3362603 RepID=A0ABW8ASG2_9ACTN
MATVKADLDTCMGYGNCVLGAEDYFDEREGVVIVLQEQVADGDVPRVEEAVAACPVMALTLQKS